MSYRNLFLLFFYFIFSSETMDFEEEEVALHQCHTLGGVVILFFPFGRVFF